MRPASGLRVSARAEHVPVLPVHLADGHFAGPRWTEVRAIVAERRRAPDDSLPTSAGVCPTGRPTHLLCSFLGVDCRRIFIVSDPGRPRSVRSALEARLDRVVASSRRSRLQRRRRPDAIRRFRFGPSPPSIRTSRLVADAEAARSAPPSEWPSHSRRRRPCSSRPSNVTASAPRDRPISSLPAPPTTCAADDAIRRRHGITFELPGAHRVAAVTPLDSHRLPGSSERCRRPSPSDTSISMGRAAGQAREVCCTGPQPPRHLRPGLHDDLATPRSGNPPTRPSLLRQVELRSGAPANPLRTGLTESLPLGRAGRRSSRKRSQVPVMPGSPSQPDCAAHRSTDAQAGPARVRPSGGRGHWLPRARRSVASRSGRDPAQEGPSLVRSQQLVPGPELQLASVGRGPRDPGGQQPRPDAACREAQLEDAGARRELDPADQTKLPRLRPPRAARAGRPLQDVRVGADDGGRPAPSAPGRGRPASRSAGSSARLPSGTSRSPRRRGAARPRRPG